MKIKRMLRGRVVIREIRTKSSILITPDPTSFNEYAKYDERTHRGIVLAKGAPPLTETGHEVQGFFFEPGDTVEFHFAGTEKGRTALWEDGEPAVWLHFEEVDAVLEDGQPAVWVPQASVDGVWE